MAQTWPDPGTVATLNQTEQENPNKLGWKGLELLLCAREPGEPGSNKEALHDLHVLRMSSVPPPAVSRD